MELVEIRDLDGPNFFLLAPAIKIELRTTQRDLTRGALADLRRRLERFGISDETTAGGLGALCEALIEVVRYLHRGCGENEPEVTWRELEEPGHVALAFGWSRRGFALGVARAVADLATGQTVEPEERLVELRGRLAEAASPEDQPGYVRDSDRGVPIVGITGTNGKTTTTRLCAHLLRAVGKRVGWTTTAGVYIDGDLVLEGDYTGPQGAHRVLREPGLDVAVLETARGGILLRGLAYESNDVGVFLNVSNDHLGLLGIRTVEGLAQVKSTVVRVTRAEGHVVLNADDALVRGAASGLRATVIFFSRDQENAVVRNHVMAGGSALTVVGGRIVLDRAGERVEVIDLSDVPCTFGGRAEHMIENVLAAIGAVLALGLSPAEIAAGLRTFQSTPEQNPGRLNVFQTDGATVIVDYAHNEAGLEMLLRFARRLAGEDGRLIAIIGTAGDRPDESLYQLGRLAGQAADEVIIKETRRYLRGRASAEEMSRLMAAGVAAAGEIAARVLPSEVAALDAALSGARQGDVVAMMCIEQQPEVVQMLSARGALLS